ncbi:MAG: hypothetical protein H7331_06540 [Bacteroidia bacterium]|nr:hypothetical protein [Bacteroidia bacterium]
MKKVYLSILSATIIGLVACGETKHEEVAADTAVMATDAMATVDTTITTTVIDTVVHVEAAVEAPAAH